MKIKTIFDYPLFALGFRPFFMLAGLSGLLLIILWNAIFKGLLVAENYYPSAYWHAHEMLLGYGGAVIAGFLLTALKNWTGKPTLTGDKLAGLCLLWLYGRIVPFYAGLLPDFLIALIDLAFLPLLAYHITKPIIETKQNQNFIFTGLLLLLITGNGFVHCEMLGLKPNTGWLGLQLIVATIIVLILVMAGRVFPFFTERGLPGTLAIRNPQLDNWSVVSAVLVFGIQLFGISGTVLALPALLAVIVNFARVAGWYVQKIWYVPLLWVLYVGYGWIIFGFALTALSAYSMIQPSLSLHAFTLRWHRDVNVRDDGKGCIRPYWPCSSSLKCHCYCLYADKCCGFIQGSSANSISQLVPNPNIWFNAGLVCSIFTVYLCLWANTG